MYSSIALEQAAPVSSIPFTSKICGDYKFWVMGDVYLVVYECFQVVFDTHDRSFAVL